LCKLRLLQWIAFAIAKVITEHTICRLPEITGSIIAMTKIHIVVYCQITDEAS